MWAQKLHKSQDIPAGNLGDVHRWKARGREGGIKGCFQVVPRGEHRSIWHVRGHLVTLRRSRSSLGGCATCCVGKDDTSECGPVTHLALTFFLTSYFGRIFIVVVNFKKGLHHGERVEVIVGLLLLFLTEVYRSQEEVYFTTDDRHSLVGCFRLFQTVKAELTRNANLLSSKEECRRQLFSLRVRHVKRHELIPKWIQSRTSDLFGLLLLLSDLQYDIGNTFTYTKCEFV